MKKVVLLTLALLLLLLLPTSALAAKATVLNESGRKVGYVEAMKVYNKSGKVKGEILGGGKPLWGIRTASHKLLAFEERAASGGAFRLYDSTDTFGDITWYGSIRPDGNKWRVYKRVEDDWYFRGTVVGGAGQEAGGALRILLWD